jgi:glutaminyl-tRNA synthetase
MSRPSYYWLIDQLELYKPVQWESGRLNIAHTVLSKRKLNELVTKKFVNGWDDPRLFTIMGLKRRGITPESINAFVRCLGVTLANTTVLPSRLDYFVRNHLNETCSRFYMVLKPLLINITNLDDSFELECEVMNFQKDESKGKRNLKFQNKLWIDKGDFKEVGHDNYFRLSVGKAIGLLNVPFPIKCTSVNKDKNGNIISIDAEYVNEPKFEKPKVYIQWVSFKNALKVQARLFENLFIHQNPSNSDEVPGGWLSDINPASLTTVTGLIEPSIKILEKGGVFQAVRIGYFCIDKDSDFENDSIVLNRTVTLKEDSKKDK